MTEWAFVLDENVTNFKTIKFLEEITQKFGGDNVYLLNDDGRLILSLWYFDEYTDLNLGCEVADRIAYWEIKNTQPNATTVDLDKVFKQKPINNCQYNFFELWNSGNY